MTPSNTFEPNWASPPGATIKRLLQKNENGISEFASSIGSSIEFVDRLIDGLEKIDSETAVKLGNYFSNSAKFWMEKERLYRTQLHTISQQENQESMCNWVGKFPARTMRKNGWVNCDKASDILAFFGVSSVVSWDARYKTLLDSVYFRSSTSLEQEPFSTIVWLRKGELEAEKVITQKWNKAKLVNSIQALRALSRTKSQKKIIQSVRAILSKCGVAFVIVPTPEGCPSSGATRFLDSEKAILQMSLRYKTDDHFWFTLFHEIGHLILHCDTTLFLENDGDAFLEKEKEANEFASEVLIPKKYIQELYDMPAQYKNVIRFAKKIKISPGIVVGQMQHRKIIEYNWLNKTKRKYSLAEAL